MSCSLHARSPGAELEDPGNRLAQPCDPQIGLGHSLAAVAAFDEDRRAPRAAPGAKTQEPKTPPPPPLPPRARPRPPPRPRGRVRGGPPPPPRGGPPRY